MRELLEIREFDRICHNPEYTDNQDGYAYLPESVFRELERFIHAFSGTEEYADALEFFRFGYQRPAGDVISVNTYVGLIQMQNGYQIQVLPKIDLGSKPTEEDRKKTKQIFIKMLRSMKDFPSKVFNEANLKVDRMTLYEIFINMYLQEVRTLVMHGLKSAYVYQEDNLSYFKGKLIVNEHIKRNTAHKENFYVGYDEHLADRPENRIVKATLLKLQSITDSAENQKEIRQLLTAFEMVSASVNHDKEFSHVVIDRSTREYEMLLRWSRVFLFNRSFTTFSGEHQARALLFPMEKVFESYVARELRKALRGFNGRFSTQDKGYYLFDAPDNKFALRPDIVITKEDGSKIVLDTKWKRLVDNPRANYGISQADMYQMYAYAKKYSKEEKPADVWLLYPWNEDMNNHAEIKFESNDGVRVRLFFVNVEKIEESMGELSELIIYPNQ